MRELKSVEMGKRKEIYKAIMKIGVSYEQAKAILKYMEEECFVEITAPSEKIQQLEHVKGKASRTGQYKGSSYKPGNILMNIKHSVFVTMLTGGSVFMSIFEINMDEPLITILKIVCEIALGAVELSKKELDDKAVLILAVLWENRMTFGNEIFYDEGYNLVNERLDTYAREHISLTEYSDLIKDLDEFGCIKLEDNKIILKEKVSIKY